MQVMLGPESIPTQMIWGNLITQVLRINQTLPVFTESQTILVLKRVMAIALPSPWQSSGEGMAPLACSAGGMKITLKALEWYPWRWQVILEMAM